MLAEGKDTLSSVEAVNDKFVAKYMTHVVDSLKVFDMAVPANHIKDIELPGLGVIGDTQSDSA